MRWIYKVVGELSGKYPEIENACAVCTFFGFDLPLITNNATAQENKMYLTNNVFFEFFSFLLFPSSFLLFPSTFFLFQFFLLPFIFPTQEA